MGDSTAVRIRAFDPPAYADQTLLENSLGRPPSSATDVHRGSTIQRVELSVLGREPWWAGCPVPELRDAHEPRACRVAYWDRDVDPEWLPSANGVYRWNPASRSDFEATFNAGDVLPGVPGGPIFPPGNYTLIARAYAARPYDLPVIAGERPDLGVVQGLASDALNLTDDNYGLYGSAFFVNVPFVSKPRLLDGAIYIDSNGTAPALYQVNVTEPVQYTVNITGEIEDGTVVRESYPSNGTMLSLLYNDSEAYRAQGYDTIRFQWDAQGRPVGKYAVYVNMTGKLTNTTANMTSTTIALYVDDQPPWIGVDPRGMPAALNATNSPGGLVTLMTNRAQLSGQNAQIRFIDIWVQEDILDAADTSIVLESRPWNHSARTTGFTSGHRVDRSTGESAEFGLFFFQAEPEPGPPRRYSFAVYHTDRAGNRVVADPETAVPSGPDCYGGFCASFLYDISPPRTQIESVDPPPSVGRVSDGNVTLLVDASETPDIARQDTYASMLTPVEVAAFERAMLGLPAVPAPNVVKPNLTFILVEGQRALAPVDGFALAGATIDATLLLLAGTSGDDVFAENSELERPLHLVIRVLDANADSTVAGPWDIDATGLLPINIGGVHELKRQDSPNGWPVTVPVTLPSVSGVYTLSVVGRSPAYANHTNFTEYREGIVVWDSLAAPDANATIKWQPPRSKLAHNNALLVLTRGIDHAGNSEEKGTYDVRLGIDLLPPNLTADMEITVMSHSVSFRVETDEPSIAKLAVLSTNGTGVANATLPLASNVHATTLAGLFPETNYTLRITLADEVGNARDLTALFQTGRAIDVAIADIEPLVANSTNITVRINATSETRVEHALELSTDGGLTFPYSVGRQRAIEIGNTSRTFRIDPGGFPESSRAQLRVSTKLLDAADLKTVTYSRVFTLDGHPPIVNVTANRSLDEPTRQPLMLTVHAADNGTGVALIEWSRGSGAFIPLEGTNLTLEGAAPETILVRATDRAGHASEPAPVRLLFDRIAPTLTLDTTILSPTSASVIPIRVKARDAHAGLRDVVARDEQGVAFRLSGRDLASGEAVALWMLDAAEGARRLSVVATDLAGNFEERALNIVIDRTPPNGTFQLVERTMSVLRLKVVLDEPSTILATAAGREGAQILASSDVLSPHTFLNATGLVPGREYAFSVRTRDAAGNVGIITDTFRTRRDTIPPTPPASLTATNLPDGSILLEWPPSYDDGEVT
ncbi:MAG: hypothetical protein WDA16_13770, partial [Candidatus Thermoplasmatota archaeon]